MSPISIKALATLAAFIGATNAHMMMGSPIPMGKATLNNSPLAADGSDFPCKLRGDSTWDESAGINKLAAGESFPLTFIGSAVHGGGSCQVSLTTDLKPTKDSKWMVIKSIEGGCPAAVSGNLAADPNGNGASQFQYTIPSDMPAGDYTIAWTWNNKIGNREMYMNCGRAKIEGAKKKRYAPTPKTSVFKRENYPDMFVANIGNGCTVAEGTDVKYPNGGADVQPGAGANLQPPTGNCGGSGSSSPPQPSSGGNEGGNSSTTPSSTAGGSSQPTVSGGVFATVTPSSAATQPTSAPSQPEASQAPSQASSAPSSQGTSSGSVTGTQSGACSDEGAWSCAPDGKSFQRCASGMWSAPMQMSTGMSCTPGVSNTFAMNAAAKRDLHGHMARRRHANIIS